MSVSWMAAVWTSSEAKGTTRLVLLALADNARDDDGVAWPSVATLARKTRVDERTVQRAIADLERLQEVKIERAGGRTNRYRLLLPRGGGKLPPRQSVTPGEVSPTPGEMSPHPRQPATPTPGRLPPKPLRNRQVTVKGTGRQSRHVPYDDSSWDESKEEAQ